MRKKTRNFEILHFDSVSPCNLLRVVMISVGHGIRKQVTVLIALLLYSHALPAIVVSGSRVIVAGPCRDN